MGFEAPLGLLAGLLAVPLTIWYVLRVRRPKVTVSSTYLWQRTDRSVAASVPWQRFRSDLTYWLVLLAILAGAIALAQPYVPVRAELGDHTILVVDASASMLADEDGPTRLELARREALDLVGRLGPGQVMSVVEAGSRPRVLLSASDDDGAIRRALSAVRPTHGRADLTDAFTLVAALERPGQRTIVHLFTDGIVPAADADAAPPGLLVNAVGQELPNLGVTRLQAVPTGGGSSQVLVQVRNFGALATRGRVTLRVDGEPVVEQELRLAPRASEDLLLTVEGASGAVLEASVEAVGTSVTGDENADALSVDDRAYALLASPREVEVLVAGPGNVFLEAALASLEGVTITTAEQVPTSDDSLIGVDVLVVDRLPAPDAPRIPTLYLAPTTPPPGIELAAEPFELPALTFQSPDHELLAAIDLSDVAIAEAQQVSAPALGTVAGGPQVPLLLAGRLDATPVVYVAFDLAESNLPLQAAWPVLVANTLSWLAGPPTTHPSIAGDTVAVALPAGSTGATVTSPSATTSHLDATGPRILVDEVGVWRVVPDAPAVGDAPEPAHIAVNADPGEGDLARSRPGPVDEQQAADDAAAGASAGRRGFGPEILTVVLVLALLEWLWATVLRPRRARRRGARRRPEPDREPEPVP